MGATLVSWGMKKYVSIVDDIVIKDVSVSVENTTLPISVLGVQVFRQHNRQLIEIGGW